MDFGGAGELVLALHGSFGRGAVFAPIADRLQGAARVAALDQRGHGLAEHDGPFTRAEFVADAAAVIDRLGSCPVVVLGHSLAASPPTNSPPSIPSWFVPLAHQMIRRRPHTQLVEFPAAGHWIHDDEPGWLRRSNPQLPLDNLTRVALRRT